MGDPCIVESGYLPPAKETYTGDRNCFYQRTGKGEQIWENDSYQKYNGDFFQDSLHGQGTYTLLQENDKNYLVEGSFYLNFFNGYCAITHSDETYFEGLMRRSKRFGPGVLTYPNGKQDVGLWYGPHLMRLCYTVYPQHVPKLAHTPLGKVKLLRFKKLVPICDEPDDVATDVLKKLGAQDKVLQISNKLYNPYVRNMNSLLFDKKLHDSVVYGKEPDCFIDVPVSTTDFVDVLSKEGSLLKDPDVMMEIMDYLAENAEDVTELPVESRSSFIESKFLEEKSSLTMDVNGVLIKDILNVYLDELNQILNLPKDERKLVLIKRDLMKKLPEYHKIPDVPIKKVPVTSILARNNEEFSIEMLKYTFLNRNLEKNVSFKVRDLLVGDRSNFGPPSDNEAACIRFLQECCVGNYRIAAELLVRKNLNPDVCDARGNTAIMFSASKDKWRVIKMLSNFGANLDKLNDDGLSPLMMCILRYLAFKEDVTDWEQAFLNDTSITQEEKEEIQEWRPHSSLVDLKAISASTSLEAMIAEEDEAIRNNLLERESLLDDLNIDLNKMNLKSILSEYYDDIRAMNVDLEYKNFQQQYEMISDPKQKYLFTTELLVPTARRSLTLAASKVKIKEGGGKKGKKANKKDKDKKGKDKKDKDKKGKDQKDKGTSKIDIKKIRSSFIKKPKSDAALTQKETIREKILNVILTTIKVLLGLGCDPNYSSVPLPSLLLAVFSKSKELTELLLQSGADPNATSMNDGLSPLLLLATLPFSTENTELFKSLLKHGANPNQKTNLNHWEDEKLKIIGKYMSEAEIFDDGKTAMDILAMRYDFENDWDNDQIDMINSLMDQRVDLDQKYLGHTPFSLAILRGNTKLIRFFIESKSVKPYAILGENMGTPLTILILKRYNNVLPVEKAKEVYDVLTEYDFNPLVDIPDIGNTVEFMDKEYEVTPKAKLENKKGKKKKEKTSSKSSKSSKSDKKGKKGKKTPIDELKDYVVFKTREMLERNILAKAFKHLRTFIILSTDPNSEIVQSLLGFFNMKNVEKLLQTLINRGTLEHNKMNVFVAYQLLNLMDKYLKKKDRNVTIGDIFRSLTWEPIPIDRIPELIEPEIDTNEETYRVCFYCCKKLDKILIVCPLCGLVYFCSQECNKLSIKQDIIHKCKYLYYDKEKQRMDNCLKSGIPYTEANSLQEALSLASQTLFNLLKAKYGSATATRMLRDATSSGALNLDALLGSSEFLRNSVENKLGIIGQDANELNKKLLGSMVMSQTSIRKGKKSDRNLKSSKSSKITVDTKSQLDTKESDDAHEKEGKKSKRKAKDSADDEKESRKGGSKKKVRADDGRDRSDKERKKPTKDGSSERDESKKSKTKDKEESRERGDAKEAAKGRSGKGGKGGKSPKGKETSKGKPISKDKAERKGKGSAKDKESTKDQRKFKDKESAKSRKGIKDGISGKDRTKRKDEYKEKTPAKDKSKAKADKMLKDKESVISKSTKKTLGTDATAETPKGTAISDETDVVGRPDDERQTEDQFSTSRGPLSCIQYVGKKDVDVKTIPTKCQFLLEELARLFPDFDFTGIIWPYVVYCDGQLYYRFLDKSPLFLETLSNPSAL